MEENKSTPPNKPPQPTAQGMSYETKTIIVVLLLLFFTPAGLILMWIWMKWPTWVKIFLTVLPFFFTFLILFFVFAVLGLVFSNPQVQKQMQQQIQEKKEITIQITTPPSQIGGTDWKTYTSDNYGFSIKYPPFFHPVLL